MITITINERTKAGKLLIETARLLAKSNKGITFEEEEDKVFKQMMKDEKTGENVSRDSVMKKLKT